MKRLIENFQNFPVLGPIVVLAVASGFAAEIIPGAAELILTPITIASAKMIDLNFDTSVMSTYYFSFTLTFFIAVTSAILSL